VRIIAGALKGRALIAPRGRDTRPTADQVRIALMDTLMPHLDGARFLDLYAGAGTVGLEALSRGAAHVTFVERDPRAVKALRANIDALGVRGGTRVLATGVAGALDRLAGEGARFDLVFLDPPYDVDPAPALERLGAGGLAPARVVVQHFTKRPPPPAVGPLRAYRTRRFGETMLTFLRGGDYDA
jgi:16S rRNA (guanine966-N2)-methyltransferase